MDKFLDLRIYRNLRNSPPFQHDRFRKGRVLQTRMLKLSPHNNDSYERMGKSLFDAGELKRCIFQLRRALIIKPHQAPQIHIALADAHRRLEKNDQCLFAIQKALYFYPTSPELHKFSIETLEKLERIQYLESFYQEIANMMKNPNRIPVLFFESAETLASCGKYPQALRNYQRAIETSKTSTQPFSAYPSERLYSRYGLALLHEGLFEEATIQFEKILETDPNHCFSLTKRAYCHYCLGRVQKAYEEFEYIIQSKLHMEAVGNMESLLPFILVLYHLEKDEEIKPYQESLSTSRLSLEEKGELRSFYFREVRRTKSLLDKDDLDAETREFYTKKHQAVSKVFRLIYG